MWISGTHFVEYLCETTVAKQLVRTLVQPSGGKDVQTLAPLRVDSLIQSALAVQQLCEPGSLSMRKMRWMSGERRSVSINSVGLRAARAMLNTNCVADWSYLRQVRRW